MPLETKLNEALSNAETCAQDGNFQAAYNFLLIAGTYSAKMGIDISPQVSELKTLVYTKALDFAERYSEEGNIRAKDYVIRQIEKYVIIIKQ